MTSTSAIRPATVGELCEAITAAAGSGEKLAIRSGGSKEAVGAATPTARPLDMSGFAGVIDYDPAELVLTVGVATPLIDILEIVAEKEQKLAFDPFDHGPIFGRPSGKATIGGVVAAGVAGPLRLTKGGARARGSLRRRWQGRQECHGL